jgi:hypothetical protein
VAASCGIEIPGFPQNDPIWLEKRMAWLKGEIDKRMSKEHGEAEASAAQGRLV